MTIPLWSLLIAGMLPYVWHFASLPLKMKQIELDPNEPRAKNDQLTGNAARAVAAQANAWEALALFGVANLTAFMAGVDPAGNWSIAAMIWVAGRSVHGVVYIAGIGVLRLLCFVVGLSMSIWIFVMALMA